jgi:hypothetical protein
MTVADSSIARMRVEDLIAAISGKGLAPGAGAAGAVTLALAVACAAKAASITLKHHPEDPDLTRSLDTLGRLAGFALEGADQDAEAFSTFIKEHTLGAVTDLLHVGDRTLHLIDVLSITVDSLDARVDASMTGDLAAARALMAAARTISVSNSAQAEAEKAELEKKS